MPDIKALIFDFDGLIIDTEMPAYESWRMLYSSHGHELTLDLWKDALGRAAGYGFDAVTHLGTLLGRDLDRATVTAERNRQKFALCERQPLLPGVLDVLAEADRLGMPCAVASSSNREWVEGWLRRHAIYDRFRCVRTVEDVARAKPAPDLFLSAAACLGIAPAACMVFEDSANGILAAKAAGMHCVVVPCDLTAQLDLPAGDLRLLSLSAMPLTEMIERVAGDGSAKTRRREDAKI